EVCAPFRMDLDQGFRNRDHVHGARDRSAHAHREVDIVDAWDVAAGKDGLPDLGALLRGERHAAAGLAALLRLPLGLTTLLALLRRRSLLTLRGLSLGLRLTLLGLRLLLHLTLLALLTLAGGLPLLAGLSLGALRAALGSLLTLALLALLALRGLA